MKSIFLLIVFCCLYVCSYGQAGSLDSTFGIDGKVTTDFQKSYDQAYTMAIEPDGKMVVAGYANYKFGLARYNTDGTLDTGFDKNGKVTTAFVGDNPSINAIAIQNDGKIVVAGSVLNYSIFDGNYYDDFALACYNTDGSPDTSFSGDGKLSIDINTVDDWASAIAIQPDGKIIACGTSYIYAGYPPSVIALVRYNTEGSLDKTFGGNGVLTIGLGDVDKGEAIAIQANGKIILAGLSDENLALIRLNQDGSFDSTFGSNGIVKTKLKGGLYASVNAIALQADNKIVVAGHDYNEKKTQIGFALWRYTEEGLLDSGFGRSGKLLTTIGAAEAYATSVSLQSDNKIVVSGIAYNNNNADFALLRCNTNGILDSSFGADGILMTDFKSTDDYGYAIRLNSNRIYVAGYTTKTSDDFAIAAYKNDASALPVIITDFTAAKLNSFIQLNWKTAQEQNINYYEIQRSTDVINFSTIGKTQAKGNLAGNYVFTDFKPLQTTNYYRLKIADQDAKLTYSKIVAVQMGITVKPIEVSPNPVKDFINIKFTAPGSNKIVIMDAAGKVIKAMEFNVTDIPFSTSINLIPLTSGIYTIKITTNDNTSTSTRFIKL